MPKSFSNINMQDLQAKNLVLDQLATDPGAPVQGQIWFNTVSNLPKVQLSARTMVISDQYLSSLAVTGILATTGGLTPSLSLTSSATSGQALLSSGTGSAPAFGALNLAGGASLVTGILPAANLPTTLAGMTLTGAALNGSLGATTPSTVAATTVSISGVFTSTVATGTAPFVVASTTPVANLNIGGNAATATNAAQLGGVVAASYALTANVPVVTTTAPLMDGTATIGASGKWSDGAHIHPTDTSRAPLASPTFTGVPAAPTAAVSTNTTQVATTAFVLGQAATVAPVMDGTSAVGTSLYYARQDHVHASDTSKANVASPTFTGTVTAPTIVASTQFTGPGTGLTGTAGSLSIGGNAATVTTNANLTGDVTSVGNATTLAAATVTGKLLTGFGVGSATAIVATDSILAAFGKAQAQLNAVSGALTYQGVWNATTNTPTLASGTGNKGYYYKVNVAGTTSIDGNGTWNIGDMIVFDGTTWDKIDGVSSEVTSVAGRVGAVTLTVADFTGTVPVNQGGTGATTPAAALANLGGVGKATRLIGDGSTLTYTFQHNLNLTIPNACHIDVTIEATGEHVMVDMFSVDANNVSIVYGAGNAPGTNAHRVTVIG